MCSICNTTSSPTNSCCLTSPQGMYLHNPTHQGPYSSVFQPADGACVKGQAAMLEISHLARIACSTSCMLHAGWQVACETHVSSWSGSRTAMSRKPVKPAQVANITKATHNGHHSLVLMRRFCNKHLDLNKCLCKCDISIQWHAHCAYIYTCVCVYCG